MKQTTINVGQFNRDLTKLANQIHGVASQAIANTVEKKFILASFDNAEVIPYTVKEKGTVTVSVLAPDIFALKDLTDAIAQDVKVELATQLISGVKGVVK